MTSEERCLLRKKVILVSFYGVELALLVAILVALFWRAMNPSFSSLDYIKRSIEATFLYDVNLIELNEICSNETRTAFTYEFLGIVSIIISKCAYFLIFLLRKKDVFVTVIW